MQYQGLVFSPSQKTNQLGIVGDGFWYVDASAADGVNTRISITPAGGTAIVLKPGQHVRLEKDAENWTIASVDGTATFTGNVVIGNGDFGDSNISNTFKLDGTFTNSVYVNNTAGQAIPVSLAGGELEIKNDSGNPINTAAIMAYTNSFYQNLAATSYTAIVSAAANVNGVIIEQVIVDTTGSVKLLAKATAPASANDGDVLSAYLPNTAYTTRTKVPAGKAVWAYNGAGASVQCSALYTLL